MRLSRFNMDLETVIDCLPVDLVQIPKPHDTNKIPCNPIDELVHTDSDDLPNPSVVSPCQYHDTASFSSLSGQASAYSMLM